MQQLQILAIKNYQAGKGYMWLVRQPSHSMFWKQCVLILHQQLLAATLLVFPCPLQTMHGLDNYQYRTSDLPVPILLSVWYHLHHYQLVSNQ
jgi:hypothetical protein